MHSLLVIFFIFWARNTLNKKYQSEWVSDCCLTPTQQFFPAISWREQINFQWDNDEVRFVLDQHADITISLTNWLSTI